MEYTKDINKIIIHVHVPKTAGTTMQGIIRRQYDNPKDLKEIYMPWGLPESLNAINDIDNIDEIKCIQGHFPYGIHRYFNRSFNYIAMLRNPIEHIISVYSYILENPTIPYYNEIMKNNLTLKDFNKLKTPYGDLNNLQTRYISGVIMRDLNLGDLERAKENVLKKFLFVGLTERFDESVFMLKQLLGWKISFYAKKNVTKLRQRQEDLPNDLLDAIYQSNEYDIELYRFTKALFDKKINELDVADKINLKVFINKKNEIEQLTSSEKYQNERFLNWCLENNNSDIIIFGTGKVREDCISFLNKINEIANTNLTIKPLIDSAFYNCKIIIASETNQNNQELVQQLILLGVEREKIISFID
ncbi:sulfotransferase family protein [Paenibacillus alginolyticus]|uniref:sulfotransferase family 2 domain-containing protein n=1 Tax=Paenibacillus alginolyticus TaxID=59839 RepID=UPI00041880AB|nr:sulfotransferase family 2 domain-containing protein [Paenibacillus alginolyticus]MCY9664841.1 sulfotransferase family protein [Paenibacillus alginolyticus]